MSDSLGSKLSGFKHKGYITDTEYDRLKKALNSLKIIEDIKADIESYEADCILADDSKECKECDKVVFGSIYRIIDKHIADKESEDKE